jgi:signal transduction histidine kinase
MNTWALDTSTTFRIIGFVYLVMPVTVWFVLRGMHEKRSLLAWCVGAGLFGLGNVLTGLRETSPEFVHITLATLTVLVSYAMRCGALDMEMGVDPRWRTKVGGVGLAMCLLFAAWAVSDSLRAQFNALLQLTAVAWLVWTAARVWVVTRLPSARLIAAAYGLFLLAAVNFVVQLLLDGGMLQPRADRISGVLAAGSSLIAAMYGSLGYVGLAIERSHRKELARAEELARESTQRLSAEQHAGQLRTWLEERDELLRLLAHEVRQPLNNAMAALHATHRALSSKDMDSGAAIQRVRRAESVLGQITGTLDNTLAATALLASPDRVEPRDVDIDTVTALSIGDLAVDLRSRVQVHRVSQVRTATMDGGLMRLALRNLLSNAGNYSPPGTPVVLRVTDCDEPLGLIFAVIDQGPGVTPELAGQLFQRGVRGRRDGGGHGLGLYVVRRVMELHGGTVDVGPNPGGGAIFRMTLPQIDTALAEPKRVGPVMFPTTQPPIRSPRKT